MSKHQPHISHYVRIHMGRVLSDGQPFYEADSAGLPEFLHGLYRHLGMQYPKFFKMDALCKASLLAAEILFRLSGKQELPENTAVILSNASSSLDTDLRHQASITGEGNFFPSPSVFVYTLPNITVGEICIKYGLKGENGFYVFPRFNAGFLSTYIGGLFEDGKTELCIGGWVEVFENTTDILLFLTEAKEKGIPFEPEELNKIFAPNETTWKSRN